jgi:hypothetical protein
MDSLLDSMFLKRFCLPSNINIKDDEYTINKCLCGTSNHIACIFKVKTSSNINKTRILNFGINIPENNNNKILSPSIHAEHNVLLKLKTLNKNKNKKETINLLVVRFSKTNKIQSSKPCSKCIKMMNIIPYKKGYKIKNIYYSNNDGNILRTTLSELTNDENKHVTKFFRKIKNI